MSMVCRPLGVGNMVSWPVVTENAIACPSGAHRGVPTTGHLTPLGHARRDGVMRAHTGVSEIRGR
jgi:hypothetical protein